MGFLGFDLCLGAYFLPNGLDGSLSLATVPGVMEALALRKLSMALCRVGRWIGQSEGKGFSDSGRSGWLGYWCRRKLR